MATINGIEVFAGTTKVMTATTGSFSNNKITIAAPKWVSDNQALITVASKSTLKFKITGKQMDGWSTPPPVNLLRTGTPFKKENYKATKLGKTGSAEFSA
ncbi:MAG: hypothetical protein JNN08_09900 [Bryobacterales bacterium]|nr:hypothetical protein [Bryobacterales bacterium]